jgi:hypothetical protein
MSIPVSIFGQHPTINDQEQSGFCTKLAGILGDIKEGKIRTAEEFLDPSPDILVMQDFIEYARTKGTFDL